MPATRMPATAGPITREALNIEEFRAMALIRSSRPTISTKNDCRAGISKAFTTPSSADRTKICQTCTPPVSVRTAKMNASSMAEIWVPITTRWRRKRSATMPPSGDIRNTGIWLEKRGDIEGVHHSQQRRQNEDMPDLHDAGERQDRQDECQQHGGDLGADHHALAAETVGHYAA